MPAAKRAKTDSSTSAYIPGAEDGSAILESSVLTVKPPTTFPVELAGANPTLTFTIPSNPRLFWDPSQTLFTASFRVVQETGTPFLLRNFSCANGLLFSSIKRLSVIINGREVISEDDFGLKYLVSQMCGDAQSTLASSNTSFYYEDGNPASTTEAFGQAKRKRYLQNSRVVKMLGKIPLPQLQCMDLWPTDAQITLAVQFHNSEFLLWEAEHEIKPKVEKLKLQITDCQLLAATKLFKDPVLKPLKLQSRFVQNTLFRYLADTDSKESNSASFVLNSYPTGFFIFLMPSDGEERTVNPYEWLDKDLIEFNVTVADREYTLTVDSAATQYCELVAQMNQFLVGRGSDADTSYSFTSFFTKERMAMGYCIGYQNCNRKIGGRQKDPTSDTMSTYAAGSPARVRFSTRHTTRIKSKFYVVCMFQNVAAITLNRQTNRVVIEHF